MANHSNQHNQLAKRLLALLLLIIFARFATLTLYPLFGTTEPRYAELARQMLVSGDWVTLWAPSGEPLWGKPPLLFWVDAASMALFGINEFGARFAPFCAAIITLGLFWLWRDGNPTLTPAPASHAPHRIFSLPAVAASLIFMGTPVGFLAAGFVATDIFLTAGMMLSMVCFWRSVLAHEAARPTPSFIPHSSSPSLSSSLSSSSQNQNQTKPASHPINQPQAAQISIWQWGFFVGIAIGLLAKGPLGLLLTGFSIFLWIALSPRSRLAAAWRCLPWFRGILLTLLLALPWYLMAEIRTPGFLHHFIVGEHFERFFVKGWAGGRFAPSHAEPLGMIWWFAVQSYMPWSIFLPFALVTLGCGKAYQKWIRRVRSVPITMPLSVAVPLSVSVHSAAMNPEVAGWYNAPNFFEPSWWRKSHIQYLMAWILSSLLLFTLSKNILEAYVLPTAPAFAILMASFMLWLLRRNSVWRWGFVVSLFIPFVMMVVVLFFNVNLEKQSQKHILQNWRLGQPLVYIDKLPPSAQFYSHNQAVTLPQFSDLAAWEQKQMHAKPASAPLTVVMEFHAYEKLTADQRLDWTVIEHYDDHIMLKKTHPNPTKDKP